MSGFVHEINSSKVSPEIVVKSRVALSQRVGDDPREAWILCRKNRDILCAYCSCTAGFGGCCNHVVAIFYRVEYVNTKGYIDPACTDLTCSWNKTTDRGVQPLKIKDAVIQKHEVSKSNKSHVLQSSFKKISTLDIKGKEEKKIWQLFNCVRKIKSNAVECSRSLYHFCRIVVFQGESNKGVGKIHKSSGWFFALERQRIGCITATKIKDVSTKVTLLRKI